MPTPNAPVRVIGGFEILSKIGQGGMGSVFKARQISLDRVVALKILPPRIAKDRTFVERFIREARVSAKLNHSNIVQGTGRLGICVGIRIAKRPSGITMRHSPDQKQGR